MQLRHIALASLTLAAVAITNVALACDAMGSHTHMGMLMSIDPAHKTFTINDAQSGQPITFSAEAAIIDGLQGYTGSVMVNYTQAQEGFTAVGVTF